MREILFRGKLKRAINPQMPAGSWIYGGYYYWKHGACIHEENAAIGLFVDKETVGQYTGLNDKNGVNIFEGDIVKEADGILFCIEFIELGYWARYWENSCMSTLYRLDEFYSQGIEVVGNIHDNPELLEARK
jgi:hypothetical protein